MSFSEYAIRIDLVPNYSEDDVQAFFTSLPDSTGFAVFELTNWESDENPHLHAYVRSTINSTNLRNKIRRVVWKAGTGNGSYSLKACDDVGRYAAYCAKGAARDVIPVVLWTCGWTFNDAYMLEKHREYWSVNATLRAEKPVKGPAVTRLLNACKEARVLSDDKTRIALEYIDMQLRDNKPINIFAARSICNTVSCLLCEDHEAKRQLAALIFPPDIPYNFS